MTQPRPEYPRPQFEREKWLNLNGEWQFETDPGVSGEEREVYLRPSLSGKITVPFCPESPLSGVGHKDFLLACWYRRAFEIPAEWLAGRLILRFGAVNYECSVWINGQYAGSHKGGYVSFGMDITDFAKPGENTIVVGAKNDVRSGKQPSGKQCSRYNSRGCSYTRTTGIWQTVWLEPVPKTYIEKCFLTPDVRNRGVHVRAVLSDYAREEMFSAEASYEGDIMGAAVAKANGREVSLFVPVREEHLWELGNGRLYGLELKLFGDGGTDAIKSYFGLRSVSLEGASFLLNGKPVYQRLVLDQGFNPEGVITAPTDEHLKRDIELSMAMGFNGARLHQKIFEPRFLYWADRLGYMLWGEHGNWGLNIADGNGLTHFLPEWIEAVERDYSSPAIIGWCPFNETQQNTDPLVLKATYQVTKAIDPIRPAIDTSGWVHIDDTDIYDYHDYDQNPERFAESVAKYVSVRKGEPFPPQSGMQPRRRPVTISRGQPVFISEFGGIGWKIGQTPGNSWGYGNAPATKEEFLERLGALCKVCLETEGVMGYCYTQLTDVEQEINGLYTYDREPKFPAAEVFPLLSAPAWNERERGE